MWGIVQLCRNPVVFREELSQLLRREELLGLVVWNLESELVLYRHDKLHMIEGVEAEVVHEVRLVRELEKTDFFLG